MTQAIEPGDAGPAELSPLDFDAPADVENDVVEDAAEVCHSDLAGDAPVNPLDLLLTPAPVGCL